MRARSILLALLAAAALRATVLQKLSIEDMIRESTGIVRARVTGARSVVRGSSIYTYYHLQVLEAAKPGPEPSHGIDVAVPGGEANGIRQVAIGAPELTTGSEYVVFLWTGKSGVTQIIGLSQGLFETARNSSGEIVLHRPASDAPMLDRNGNRTPGEALGLSWAQLRRRISKELKQ